MKNTSHPVTAAALRNAAPGEEVGHTGHNPMVKGDLVPAPQWEEVDYRAAGNLQIGDQVIIPEVDDVPWCVDTVTREGRSVTITLVGRTVPIILPFKQGVQVVRWVKWVPRDAGPTLFAAPPKPAASLTELAAAFGSDRRQREVVKKRFATLHGKLAKLDPAERRAFIAYINSLWP